MAEDSNLADGKSVKHGCVNLLLVEDNQAEARILQEILKGTMVNRFNLAHVKRLGEAIALLQNSVPSQTDHPFDIILLDLTLPDSVGLDSLDSMIQHAPSLPIVVLTNTNDDDLAVEAVRHGAQDYLVKRHINQELLVRSLRYAIERKQAAEALREANEILEQRVQERTLALATSNQLLKQEIEWRQCIQERLELAQKAGRIGSFEWNVQSNILTWSPELEALYGMAPGSFEGRYDEWIQAIHPDDQRKIAQEIDLAIQQGNRLDSEFRILHPNGDIHWMAVKSSLFHDAEGNPQRMIGIHIDITDKKQLESQFLRAQRLESLGTLASGIAHDLNNILTPILAGVQLLPMKVPGLNDQTLRLLKTLEASAKRGADLVKQILSFARGVEGKRVYLQMNYLLTEVEQIIQQTLPKSIEIKTKIPKQLWSLYADMTQLHQVLMNLCVNARDAMPEGGILQISAENVILDEESARLHLEAHPGQYVAVTISDTGTGIPPEILHRIFDPFFTTKEVGKGTGLGLSAVLGIVKSHAGFVDVQTELNRGSRFTIYLPASEVASLAVSEDLELLSGNQELILVVDDELSIRELIKTTLETYNYRVLTAKDGIEAMALVAEHQDRIHCIFLDMMMPTMDGFTVLPLLRRLNSVISIVAMSGLLSTEMVTQAEKLGVQGFLPKPFITKDLLQAAQLGQIPGG